MSAIEEIIRSAREAGASDVHLAAGMSPKMRIGGELFSMNCSRLTAADMLDIPGMADELRRPMMLLVRAKK